jgi:hypothetical protein
MIPSSSRRGLAAAGACALAFAGLHAPAFSQSFAARTINVSATSICDAPLPVYNVQLRKRPVAVQNESTEAVFVTCTLPADFVGFSQAASVRVDFQALGAGATIACTMVSGIDTALNYVTREQAVPGGGTASIQWDAIDKRTNAGTYAFNCLLPAGVAMETISHTQVGYSFEI